MNKIYDALIVGAGPAGAFAAELLARQGACVALFDGRPPSEPKACGGGVTSKGLKAYPFLLDAAARTIDEVVMYAPDGQSIKLELEEPFAVFSRRNLDMHLCERARKSGAEIFNERVTLVSAAAPHKINSHIEAQADTDSQKLWRVGNRNGTKWRGKILVAADGANSAIAKRLAGALPNSEMEVAFGYRAPLRLSADAPTVIAFLPGYAGYAWAFPRLDHISFGIATAQSTFKHKVLDEMLWRFMLNYYRAREEGNARAHLWSFDKRGGDLTLAQLENELREIVEPYAARIPGVSPQVWAKRSVAGANWVLLGDAAGFADSVTGEGIYYALRSSELFAESFAANDICLFETKWRADFGRELRRAGEMRNRFYGTFFGAPFTERMIQLALTSRGIRRTMRELIAGEQGYLGLKRKLAIRAVVPFAS